LSERSPQAALAERDGLSFSPVESEMRSGWWHGPAMRRVPGRAGRASPFAGTSCAGRRQWVVIDSSLKAWRCLARSGEVRGYCSALTLDFCDPSRSRSRSPSGVRARHWSLVAASDRFAHGAVARRADARTHARSSSFKSKPKPEPGACDDRRRGAKWQCRWDLGVWRG
jgi:hypothetical protein